MDTIRLGRTGLIVSRSGFGALPIQRLDKQDAVRLLRRAREGGINFFDTARGYSDSEEKLGAAFGGAWDGLILATKTPSTTYEGVMVDFQKSCEMLKRQVIDIYQLHNPAQLPDPEDPAGSYAALRELKEKGLVRFIGITQHKIENARRAVDSGLYDTLQYPLSAISSPEELELVTRAKEKDMGVIGMKGLCGGLITDPALSFALLRQYDNLVPIWGIQRQSELEDFLRMEKNPPALDEAMRERIDRERRELGGNFCRGCGYCMPCPQGIQINTCARMAFLLRRAPYRNFTTDHWRTEMERIETCLNCGQCTARCPYHLDTPRLLKDMLEDYRAFCRELDAK